MVNTINSNTELSSSLRGTRNDAAKARTSEQGAPSAPKAETPAVSLSDTALELQKLSQSEETPVRQEKVDALKAALARGESIIDSDKVAQNMLDLEL